MSVIWNCKNCICIIRIQICHNMLEPVTLIYVYGIMYYIMHSSTVFQFHLFDWDKYWKLSDKWTRQMNTTIYGLWPFENTPNEVSSAPLIIIISGGLVVREHETNTTIWLMMMTWMPNGNHCVYIRYVCNCIVSDTQHTHVHVFFFFLLHSHWAVIRPLMNSIHTRRTN